MHRYYKYLENLIRKVLKLQSQVNLNPIKYINNCVSKIDVKHAYH